VVDHFSRRVIGFAVFSIEPTSVGVRAFLNKLVWTNSVCRGGGVCQDLAIGTDKRIEIDPGPTKQRDGGLSARSSPGHLQLSERASRTEGELPLGWLASRTLLELKA
jgi:hypothetical protein